MLPLNVELVEQSAPAIRMFISNGSERSDYLPQRCVMELLGRPHAGQNVMACYYPKQSFWPERRLFGPDVPHYRHSRQDSTGTTKLADLNQWTDGYYSMDLRNPDNDVVRQMADVRRYGQDVRLTLTADLDTTDEDLQAIGRVLEPFGPVELRLNHEANGCGWFRFAKGVGGMTGEAQKQLYYQISQFFIRAHRVVRSVAPRVRLIACYNGPSEPAVNGEVSFDDLPAMRDDELGLMYRIPDAMVSLDQYGSLHYGWPGHRIAGPPIIGKVTHQDHGAFALTSWGLCEGVIRPFQQAISRKRGVPTRIDLGELDFDEDIHGPEIRAQLLYECYDWIRRHPQIIGSVTFYELLDMGGLGLLRQKAYGNTDDLDGSVVLKLYRQIMDWKEFQPVMRASPLPAGSQCVPLRWTSSSDAVGLRVGMPAGARTLDLREQYWRRVIFSGGQEQLGFVHSDSAQIPIPAGADAATVFALPPDGRDNTPVGFVRQVPIPGVQ